MRQNGKNGHPEEFTTLEEFFPAKAITKIVPDLCEFFPAKVAESGKQCLLLWLDTGDTLTQAMLLYRQSFRLLETLIASLKALCPDELEAALRRCEQAPAREVARLRHLE